MKHHLGLAEKQVLVSRYLGGETVSAICTETDIPKSTLYTWIKQYQPTQTRSGRVITPKDYDSLLRRCEKQEQLIAVLKTVGCLPSAPLRENSWHWSGSTANSVSMFSVTRWMYQGEPSTTTSNATSGAIAAMPSIVRS